MGFPSAMKHFVCGLSQNAVQHVIVFLPSTFIGYIDLKEKMRFFFFKVQM